MITKSHLLTALLVCCVLAAACTAAPAAGGSTPRPTPVGGASADPQAGLAKLNLNTASPDEFSAAIPGLGNRMVREFLEYRPYVSIQQFRREIGKYVDDQQVADYERYVYVPIAVNDSDAATLQQIPGLDESETQSLIAGRPFASND